MNRILNIVERHTPHRAGRRHGTGMAIIRKSRQIRWHRKHLIGLRDLSADEITYILDTAKGFEQVSTRSVKKAPPLRGKVVVNLFFASFGTGGWPWTIWWSSCVSTTCPCRLNSSRRRSAW